MNTSKLRNANERAARRRFARRIVVGVLTLAAGALTLSGRAQPAPATAWQDPQTIVATATAAAMAAGAGGVETATVDSRIKLKECAGPLQARVERAIERGRGTIVVSCAGPEPWRLFVPVRTVANVSAVVLARALQPGEVLREQDLAVERRPAGSLPYGYVTNVTEAVGLALRRSQAAGTVLVVGALEHPEVVERGSLVTLISEAGGVSVKSEGVALEPGRLRQRVRVRSASGRVVEGRAEALGVVRVGS
jgi:flagella basal body P-ring formation protein FlgA